MPVNRAASMKTRSKQARNMNIPGGVLIGLDPSFLIGEVLLVADHPSAWEAMSTLRGGSGVHLVAVRRQQIGHVDGHSAVGSAEAESLAENVPCASYRALFVGGRDTLGHLPVTCRLQESRPGQVHVWCSRVALTLGDQERRQSPRVTLVPTAV